MKSTKVIILLLLHLFTLSFNAKADDILGVNFDKVYSDEGISLNLQGTGLKTMVFFKAFAAGYYRDDEETQEVLGEFSKRIEVEYFVKIPGKKLNNFTIDTMKDNVTKEEFNAISNEIDLMGKYFVDLKPGDRFSLTYIPGVGTKFAHNNEVTGVIKGNDFAKALFSVWIGENPFDRSLKEKILGLENSKSNQENNLVKLTER